MTEYTVTFEVTKQCSMKIFAKSLDDLMEHLPSTHEIDIINNPTEKLNQDNGKVIESNVDQIDITDINITDDED